MTFYDHFTQKEKMPTRIGMNLVKQTDRKIIDIFKKLAKKKDINLLEIGPGRGMFARQCKKQGIKYTAIEINPILADDLKDNGFNVLKSNVPPIPIESNKFDIVHMNQVFEHMNDFSVAQELIKECYRVLKKNGILCIISPDYLMWREEFFNVDYTHNYVTTLRRLNETYYDNNLKIVSVNYISGPFFGNLTTFILSIFSMLFIRPKLIHLLTLKLVSEDRLFKIKYTLLRSFMIVGKKI